MALANRSVKLGASNPKTKAVVANGVPTVATGELGIYTGSAIATSNPQWIVGQFDLLYRYAKTFLKDLTGTPCVLHMPLGGNYSDVVVNGTAGDAPGTSDIRLIIGAGIHGGDKSHFLNRTFRRVIEAYLEDNK